MLGLWGVLLVTALSHDLHRRLHSDLPNLKHECVLTLLCKGHLLTGQGGAISVPPPLAPAEEALLVPLQPVPVADYQLPPSRAPPPFPLPF
jgi:hypothetical protein